MNIFRRILNAITGKRSREVITINIEEVKPSPGLRQDEVVPSIWRSGRVLGFEENTPLNQLLEHKPEVREALEASEYSVLYVGGSGEPLFWDGLSGEEMAEEATSFFRKHVERFRSECGDGPVLLIGECTWGVGRMLYDSGLIEVDGVPVIGLFEHAEGGVAFMGTDGTVVNSEDWKAGAEYGLEVLNRWAREESILIR